jgi:hypothetical protein
MDEVKPARERRTACQVPFEIFFVAALVGGPFIVWREIVRLRRFRAWPLLPLRMALAAAIVATAAGLPVKYDDTRRLEGLRSADTTLGEIGRTNRFYVQRDCEDVAVKLPSTSPTFRQAVAAIESQTGLRCRVGRCGNGKTVLWGAYIMSVDVSRPEAPASRLYFAGFKTTFVHPSSRRSKCS